MDLHLWLGFALASLVIGLVPGPGVIAIVGTAIGSGRRVAFASVAGMAIGNVAAMSLSLAGAGALLAASATAFQTLKWAGAVYLIGLGLVTIVKPRRPGGADPESAHVTPAAALARTTAIGLFHPKTIVFFVAFAPQFITPRGPYALQAAALVATFALIVGVTDVLYALVASSASVPLSRPRALRWSRRASGGVLIAAGIAAAAAQRS